MTQPEELPIDPEFIQPTGVESSEEPQDEATILERLKNIDYSDHKGAMVAAGAAVVGLVALGYAVKKHGIVANFADRHNQEKGVISLTSADGKLAASLPVNAEVLKKLKDKDIFAMHRQEGERGHRFSYPLLGGEEHAEEHSTVLRRLIGRIISQ